MIAVEWITFFLTGFLPIYFFLICKMSVRKRAKDINSVYVDLKKNELFGSLGIGFQVAETILKFYGLFTLVYAIYMIGGKGVETEIYKTVEGNRDFLSGLINIIVTLAVALIVYNKTIYIVFSLRDYLNEYNFGYNFIMMMVWGTGTYIVTMHEVSTILSLQCVLGITMELFCVYYVVKCFIIEYVVLFGEKNIELKILNKLYRIYNIKNVRYRLNGSDVIKDKEAVEINLEHLLRNYNFCYQRAKGENISDIEYIHYSEMNSGKWIKEAKSRYLILSGVMCTTAVVILASGYGINCKVILLVFLVVSEYVFFCKSRCLEKGIVNLWKDSSGFCVSDKIKKNGYYVDFGLFSLKKERYLKFVYSVTSIAGFTEIILTEGYDDKNFINILEAKLAKIDKKHAIVGKEVLPYYIIGYLLYKKKYKIKHLRRLYKNEKEQNFDKMLCAFMEYVDKGNGIEKRKKYMNWLAGD